MAADVFVFYFRKMENKVLRGRSWSVLLFITNGDSIEKILQGAQLALQGGCRWIQLRWKDAPERDLEAAALVLKPLCKEYGAVLIVDDNVALAKSCGLDGVHLGLTDMPIHEARKILGENFIIGGTANTSEQALHQVEEGADYLGIGPYKYTDTKKNISALLGVEGYKVALAALDSSKRVPVVAIGGIEVDDVPDVMAAGVDGVAVSGCILRAENPVEMTAKFIRLLASDAC